MHYQRGAALVVAMLIFALAAALVVAMQSEFDRFFQRSAHLLADEQLQAYLRAGEELAAIVLLRDYDDDKQERRFEEKLDEIWNRPETRQPFPIEGVGWFQGELEETTKAAVVVAGELGSVAVLDDPPRHQDIRPRADAQGLADVVIRSEHHPDHADAVGELVQ